MLIGSTSIAASRPVWAADTPPESSAETRSFEAAALEGTEAAPVPEEVPSEEEPPDDEPNFVFRYLESIFGTPENSAEPRIIAYPVLAFAPETDWEVGVSVLGVYYANDDIDNRLSEINAYGFATFAGQLGLRLDHALYTDRDQWFFLGEVSFESFPLQYYGIGPNTPSVPSATISEVALVIRERILYRLAESLYLGPELSFDLITDIGFDFVDGVDPALPAGSDGSLNLGVGLGLVFDQRHNVLNVREGLFSELALLHYDSLWASDFDFTVVESDTRYFVAVNERDTLAFQLMGRFAFGDEIPFNELSLLGGDGLMRGYYRGRFRDRHFVGAQVEYRFLPLPFFEDPFWRRFGASLFVGTGTVFPGPDLPSISDFVIAGGGGLRFLLMPDKDIHTRLDIAVTEEGPTYYLRIGEAF